MKIQKIIPLFWILFAILAIFIGRTIMAKTVELPCLFEIFEIITFTGCLAILPQGRHFLKRSDWGIAIFLAVCRRELHLYNKNSPTGQKIRQNCPNRKKNSTLAGSKSCAQ
jgi:hypothetical protein